MSSNPKSPNTSGSDEEVPIGTLAGLTKYARHDVVSGFLVFLIALPLCLGISVACGYPPIAGIFTAIIGSVLTTFVSNSELTIKGPAAGLIVIAIGCIEDFGGDGIAGGFTSGDMSAYQMALAVGVAAAVLQILFGLFRGGILGEFFPLAAVHGMLAAIGVIIIAKQVPVALGVSAKGEPLELLAEIPRFVNEANPEIAAIGVVGILIMFLWPPIAKRLGPLRAVPSPMVVILVAVPMGMMFDLTHHHAYTLFGQHYEVGEEYLVAMPDRPFGMFDDITFPDFSALAMPKAWKWVFMFFIIGSLESLLSAKAVDVIDPWKRKTNMDRDVLAVGIGNLAASFVGGLPMISEIVRSKANIDNGARTRFADMWHGIFLLLCVGLIPTVLHLIPLSALAAMLVYTGFRLAHPAEFAHVKQIGNEQLLIFVTTLIAVLATDLLIGIGVGIVLKMIIHVSNGVQVSDFFKAKVVETRTEEGVNFEMEGSAVFSNWIPLKRKIDRAGLKAGRPVVLDLRRAHLVDHSVMEKLHEMNAEFRRQGLEFRVEGLDLLQQTSSTHAFAARKRGLASLRRVTVVGPPELETVIIAAFVEHGASGYTSIPCSGLGQRGIEARATPEPRIRIEVVLTPDACESMLDHLRKEIVPGNAVTTAVETVDVLCPDDFVRGEEIPANDPGIDPGTDSPAESAAR